MSQFYPHIREAAADFRYLLDRGYPRRAALALVGDRYGLNRTGRQLLHRGVFAPEEAAARRAKLRPLAQVARQPLGVDGHNVLITLECARRGLPLVAADDGFIRDVGEISRAFRLSSETHQVLALLADFLAAGQVREVHVFYDAPLSRSGELARHTAAIFADRGLKVAAAAAPVPEKELAAFPGAVCTSDTALIDRVAVVVDLAGELIREQLRSQNLIDLQA
ncbi:MAG: DUF434 domain-containing protein [Deltaproteobacteria bacterium]|nr:DUF434 domain-containing protein [Deltaproteobacteria bacterium]